MTALWGATASLTACVNTSSIQSEYVGVHEDCVSNAEQHTYELNEKQALSQEKQKAETKNFFVGCLRKEGWKLSNAPAPAPKPAAPTNAGLAANSAVRATPTIQPIAVPIIITQPIITPMGYAAPMPPVPVPMAPVKAVPQTTQTPEGSFAAPARYAPTR